MLRLLASVALAFYVVALEATRLLPAKADAFVVEFFSDMRGMGTEAIPAACTSSRNFLKSLSAIFLPDDYFSSFTCSFDCRFFSGVTGVQVCFGVGGFATSFCGLATSSTCGLALGLTEVTLLAALFSCLTVTALFCYLTVAALFSYLTDGLGVTTFLAEDFAALALRVTETDFAVDAFLDFASFTDLAEAILDTGFLLDALLLDGLLTTLTVISGASFPIFSVF